MDRFARIVFLMIFASVGAKAADTPSNEVTIYLPSNKGADSLQPDYDGFSGNFTSAREGDYAKIVMSALPEIYAPSVRLRAFFENAFSGTEGAVAVRERDGQFQVIAGEPTVWLWPYTKMGREQAKQFRAKRYPANFRDVPVRRCVRSIDARTAHDLIDLWSRMLTKIERDPFVTPPADDAWVYFAMPVSGGTRSGSIWTSYQQPKVQGLISVADDLSSYCMHPSRKAMRILRADTQKALSFFNSGRQ